MAEKGVAAVSVEQILLAAGMSRGTFYGYCRGRAELVAAVIEPVFADGIAALEGLASQPAMDVVPAIIDLYVQLWARHRNALLITAEAGSEVFALLRGSHARYTWLLRQQLQRAAAAGELRNGSAEHSFRVLTLASVSLLRVYADHPDQQRLYGESMGALLLAKC